MQLVGLRSVVISAERNPDSSVYYETIYLFFSFLYIFVSDSFKMDFSKLPKFQDEEQEGAFGYVHGVSGPG